MHNFIASQYQQAINYWQRVINANRLGVNVAALKEAVAEANIRLGNVPNNANNSEIQAQAGSQSAATNTNNSSAADTGPQLNVKVSLSDEVHALLAQGEDRVVFIYGRAKTRCVSVRYNVVANG